MRRPAVLFALLLSVCIADRGVAASRRVALVIGNGAYAGDRRTAPIADAEAVRQKLINVGFEVLPNTTNLKVEELKNAIAAFRAKLMTADEAVFFYAGHGAQRDGENFMLPVGAGLIDEASFKTATVSVGTVYEAMRRGSSRFNLVMLDMCRNNPALPPPVEGNDRLVVAAQPGLAEPTDFRIPSGTIIAFSTRPGTLSIDAEGNGHSPYTMAMLDHLETPGMTIQEFFMRVRNRVLDDTSQGQTPWETTSQLVDFAFRSPAELEVTVLDADDEVMVTANGQSVVWGVDARTPRAIRLRTGDNVVRVLVHNDANFRNHNPMLRRQGWKHEVQLRILPADGVATPPPPPLILKSGETGEPPNRIPDSRWGATFVAAAARIVVGRDGQIQFAVVEQEVWKDGFSLADTSERDELDLALAWPFWRGGVRLYNDDFPGGKRNFETLRAETTERHRREVEDPTLPGSSASAHEFAAMIIESAEREEFEEALRRVEHFEVSRQAHGATAHLEWAVRMRPNSFQQFMATRNYEELRRFYASQAAEGPQAHNENARNVLGVLSNQQIDTIVRKTLPP